jgi:hypothetical protein
MKATPPRDARRQWWAVEEDYLFFLPFLAVFLTAFFAFFTIRTSFG